MDGLPDICDRARTYSSWLPAGVIGGTRPCGRSWVSPGVPLQGHPLGRRPDPSLTANRRQVNLVVGDDLGGTRLRQLEIGGYVVGFALFV